MGVLDPKVQDLFRTLLDLMDQPQDYAANALMAQVGAACPPALVSRLAQRGAVHFQDPVGNLGRQPPPPPPPPPPPNHNSRGSQQQLSSASATTPRPRQSAPIYLGRVGSTYAQSTPPPPTAGEEYKTALADTSTFTGASMGYIVASLGTKGPRMGFGMDTGSSITIAKAKQLYEDMAYLMGPNSRVETFAPIQIGTFKDQANLTCDVVVRNALITVGTAVYELDIFGVHGTSMGYTVGLIDMIKLGVSLHPAQSKAAFSLRAAQQLRPGHQLPERPRYHKGPWHPEQEVPLYWKRLRIRMHLN